MMFENIGILQLNFSGSKLSMITGH